MAIPSKEELLDAAFKRWWEKDYSWEGLAEKPWQDGPEGATLQDYWREKGAVENLFFFAGRNWTRFHMPMRDLEGKPSPKAEWSGKQKQALTDRIVSLATTNPESVEETNRTTARLNGVVVPGHIGFVRSHIQADFTFAIFSRGVNFRDATFSRRAYFSGATFSGGVDFRDATFGWYADFQGASFSGTAHFRDAYFGDAYFGNATFSGAADFVSASFSRDADFGRVAFSGHADFGRVAFSGPADFSNARFSGAAGFNKTTFGGEANFDRAKFDRDAEFDQATFSDGGDFEQTKFGGDASFQRATFDGLAVFRAKLGESFGRTMFTGATFGWDADFSGRAFQDQSDFSSAVFERIPIFHGAKLHPDTSFLDTDFRRHKMPREEIKLVPNWRGPVTKFVGPFYRLARRTYFRFRKGHRFAREPLKHLAIGLRAARALDRKLQPFLFRIPFGLRFVSKARAQYDMRTQSYENAYRTLRDLSAANNKIEHEMMFYRLERDAHRAQTDVPMTDRVVASIFKWSSDYGTSLLKPVRAWFEWMVIACVLWVFAVRSVVPDTPPGDILPFVAGLHLPLPWVGRLLPDTPDWVGVVNGELPGLLMGMGAFHGLTSLVFFALFFVALRRKFQIR